MKKGCFLKLIIILTIVVAAILYLIQNKFDEYFLEPGKELALSIIENSWDEDLKYVKESVEKDSLKSLMKFYITELKSSAHIAKKSDALIKYISATLEDSIIDMNELNSVRQLINESLQNEE